MKKINCTLFIVLMSVTLAIASQKRKVLFIGIDGCRPDAIQAATTPNLDSIVAHGAYTFQTWCCGITVSGPTWSSMMTGVWYPKHGVTDNSYSGSNFGTYNEFPALVKKQRPYLYAAEVCEWAPLIVDVPNIDDGFDVRTQVTDGSTVPTYTAAATLLADTGLDVLFVYFDAVDLAGHANGFSPLVPNYITAIETVDLGVGHVMNALKSRVNYANEDWLVLLCTDHGGIGTGHGGNTPQEREIWWFGAGSHIRHLQLNNGADPGSYRVVPPGVDPVVLKQTPVHTDIAVTAIHHLLYDDTATAYKYPQFVNTWNLDGRSWLDTMYIKPSAVPGIATEALEVVMYPNPANNLVTLWFDNKNQPVSWSVVNLLGIEVLHQSDINLQGYKLNIDLQSLQEGNYVIRLQCGNQATEKKVVVLH